jgi:hypothetical protein
VSREAGKVIIVTVNSCRITTLISQRSPPAVIFPFNGRVLHTVTLKGVEKFLSIFHC